MSSNRKTPSDLRVICDSLNIERGTDGQSKLARLLDWDDSTLWPRLNGKSPITQSDELATPGYQRVLEAAQNELRQ